MHALLFTQVTSSLDVGEAVVNPSFRSTPWQAERDKADSSTGVRIAFVSESNICRSPLAAALMQQCLEEQGLANEVKVSSRVCKLCNLHAYATLLSRTGDLGHCSPNLKAASLNMDLRSKLLRLQATRDYTIGEGPHPSAQVAANGLGVQLPVDFKASRFDYTDDTVHFDLILVMDKFTAGDVMREVRRIQSGTGMHH